MNATHLVRIMDLAIHTPIRNTNATAPVISPTRIAPQKSFLVMQTHARMVSVRTFMETDHQHLIAIVLMDIEEDIVKNVMVKLLLLVLRLACLLGFEVIYHLLPILHNRQYTL